MKHAELLRCLQGIKNRQWGSDGLSKLEELIRTLKANPPLAEVEECDLHRYSTSATMYHLESVFKSQKGLCEEGTTILVTATIRKRAVVG